MADPEQELSDLSASVVEALESYIEFERNHDASVQKALEKIQQSFLPPLKTDASGCECSEKDGIDRNDRDFMRGRVQGIIESGAIGDKGWLVHTTAYEINMGVAGTAIAGHNIVLRIRNKTL